MRARVCAFVWKIDVLEKPINSRFFLGYSLEYVQCILVYVLRSVVGGCLVMCMCECVCTNEANNGIVAYFLDEKISGIKLYLWLLIAACVRTPICATRKVLFHVFFFCWGDQHLFEYFILYFGYSSFFVYEFQIGRDAQH